MSHFNNGFEFIGVVIMCLMGCSFAGILLGPLIANWVIFRANSGDSECFSVLHDFCLLHTILFALLVGLPCLASILCSRSNDMICCVLGLGAGITHIVFGSKYVSIISSRSSYSCQLAPDAISNMVYADVLISLIGGSLFLAATLFYCIASYFNNPTFFLREIIPHHNTYRNTK
eukprot:TRINITY_DN11748_c1_g2_i1.p1 TRINITY_DN11748_c1_g2~~TRINITY_DN11748_c1_g2_i1.p1  ORF type:complete len:174 (+),score=21.30 TRINITY_DN11748_c1_g2_i1:107-628(+)